MPARQLFLSALIALCAIPVAGAQNPKGIEVARPYAVATMPGAPTGAVYLSIRNNTKKTEQLIGASTPRAKRVELHAMSMTGNVMRMREVGAIELKPGAQVRMQPGSGQHLMLAGLAAPLSAGEEFPLTLQCRSAGKMDVTVRVEQAASAKPEPEDHLRH